MRRLSQIAFLILMSAAFAAPAAATTAPVGQWKLNEGQGTQVADSSGNGNNGTLFGDVAWTSGIAGSALDFVDGSSGVKIIDNSVLEPVSTVTVSAWIKQSSSPGGYRYIVAKGATGCSAASYGLYSGPNGGLEFYVSRARGTKYERSPDAGTRVWDGSWHYAVGTFDGTTVRLYVDGAEIGSGTPYPGNIEYLLRSSNDFYIGDYPGCASRGFRGAIDDVTVWNRALTPAEIAAAAAPGGAGNPSGSGSGSGSGGAGGSSSGSGQGSSGGGGAKSGGGTSPSNGHLKVSALTITFARHARWPTINYTDSRSASSNLQIFRGMPGLRHGTRCIPAGSKPVARAARCVRLVRIAHFAHRDRAGRNHVSLAGRLRHPLTPGSYRAVVTPRAGGMTGRSAVKQFVVRTSHR